VLFIAARFTAVTPTGAVAFRTTAASAITAGWTRGGSSAGIVPLILTCTHGADSIPGSTIASSNFANAPRHNQHFTHIGPLRIAAQIPHASANAIPPCTLARNIASAHMAAHPLIMLTAPFIASRLPARSQQNQ
jgi:hypothetical protein